VYWFGASVIVSQLLNFFGNAHSFIISGLFPCVPVTKTLRNIGCKPNLSGRIITWFYAEEDRKKKFKNRELTVMGWLAVKWF
jgi:hypothetical protein